MLIVPHSLGMVITITLALVQAVAVLVETGAAHYPHIKAWPDAIVGILRVAMMPLAFLFAAVVSMKVAELS